MPFDAPNYAARYATPADDTPYARRRTLIAALRAELPRDFVWDYEIPYCPPDKRRFFFLPSDMERHANHCGTVGCAAGLAKYLGLAEPGMMMDRVGARLGLDRNTSYRIFNNVLGYGCSSAEDVTPAMVADALEATLPESER